MTKKKFEIIATAFDKKGRVIYSGINNYSKSHPLMRKYALIAGEHPERLFIHAELLAILRAGERQVHSLLVQRFLSNGELALAMPCPICKEIIKDFGIKEVTYSDYDGYKIWRVS